MRMRMAALLWLLVCPGTATAQLAASPGATWRLSYDGYASGFRVMTMTADITLGAGGYRIAMAGRTGGLIGVFYRAEWQAIAEGAWGRGGVAPTRYDNAGTFGGTPRHIALDFAGGDPIMRIRAPADDPEYEPVPLDRTRGAIDGLSVLALVLRQMQGSGECSGQLQVFDGHQLDRNALAYFGGETLPPSSRSSFAGVTQRCDITAQTLSGFYRPDPKVAHRTNVDSIWIARPLPDAPALPVRMTATTNQLGQVMLYMTDVREAPVAVVRTNGGG
jgi:hypothetical protein